MAHIDLPDGVPGIVGPMAAYPEAGAALTGLAEVLLRGPSSLIPAERELIAAYVSSRNECYFCTNAHAATARELYGETCDVVDLVMQDGGGAAIGEKMKALLVIADQVRQDGRLVREADVARAHAAGADDRAIHDTVLVAAAFCMFTRYVDGLATWAPRDADVYRQIGQLLATRGYAASPG